MAFLWYLCVALLCSGAESRKRFARRNGYASPLDNFVNRIDDHNYWLQNQLKKEDDSTLNEISNYPNDQIANTEYTKLDKKEDEINMHYIHLATMNVNYVLDNGKCKTPTKKCLDMHRLNSGTAKSYWPPCAIVYKCEHDSGCCIGQGHVCSPVDSETIQLYFFSFTSQDHGAKSRGRVERFSFDNHTECGCRPPSVASSLLLHNSDNQTHSYDNIFDHSKCRCPKHFVPSSDHQECLCTCQKKNARVCRRIIKGKRSYHTKGCKGKCDPPICEYGKFKSDFSRCPRKSERKRRRRRHHSS